MEKENVINGFTDEYAYLDDFYPCKITYQGLTYLNAHAAFVSMMLPEKDAKRRRAFTRLNGLNANSKAKHIIVREDWEGIKDFIKREVLYQKFLQNPDLREKLLATGDMKLVNKTTWADDYFGVYNGKGKNKSGILLMEVRDEFRKER